eukprot:gene10637-2752_t
MRLLYKDNRIVTCVAAVAIYIAAFLFSAHLDSSSSLPPWETSSSEQDASTKSPVSHRADEVMKFDVDETEEEKPALLQPNVRGLSEEEELDPWKRKKQNFWRLMILFQHNFPILKQAIESFQRGSDIMVQNMIIVDNSVEKEALHSPWIKQRVSEVVVPERLLNFPELHNFMATLALRRQLQFYFWAHADNYVLPLAPQRDLGKDALDCLREHAAKYPDWGMILFAYDHLAAYRTQALIQVPWDPHVFQYGSECDAYGRIRDAGYETRACKVHYSYDMKRVVGIADSETYDHIKAKLEQEAKDKTGRNQWREKAMSPKEQQWRQEMKQFSRAYLTDKWGEIKCKLRGVPCNKPWPYCPRCPVDMPNCFNKNPSWAELENIHKRVHQTFLEDPNQPPKLLP